jgi:diguanylate cyclase (GGDEF)-like protein/PAS domain S-box-containing protein
VRVRWFVTLKARLMAASVLVIAASVAGSTLFVIHRVEQRSEQAVTDLERDHAERVASMLQQRVIAMQRMLRATAQTMPELARSEHEAATAFIADKPALQATFSTLFVAATDGELLALHDGTASAWRPMNLAPREYFAQTLAQGVPLVSAPLSGRFSQEPIIQFTMPVLEGRRVVAVMGGTLRLRSRNLFDDLTYAGASGTDRTVTIVTDSRGTIISHPRRERVLLSIETEPGLAEVVARWVMQGRPVEPAAVTVRNDGRFVSMAGVPAADWVVFRLVPDADLMGGMVQARREALQWALGVAVIGGLLTLALVAWMLGPLSQLRARALQLQDDDHHDIGAGWPRARGEIGELSRVLQRALRERMQGEKAKHALVQQMSSVLAAAPIGIAFTRQRRFELVGDEFNALLGWQQGELIGRPAREIFASDNDYDAIGPQVKAAFAEGRPYFGEVQFRRRDGSVFWGRLQGRPVDARDPDAGTIWLVEDVTEHREARERLSWSASHDMLTRLLNRAAFEERLSAWLAQPRGVPASLLFVDLDRFKRINDSAGHAAGDGVLREVARIFQAHVRAGDAAARIGGDEFALLLPGCVGDVALQLGERLRRALSQVGIVHDGVRLTIGASIGVAEVRPGEGLDAAAWLARADAACYDAKRAGRDAVRLAPDAPAAVLAAID